MSIPKIEHCPGTLAVNHETYSTTCLRRVFNGRSVSHILPDDFLSLKRSDKGLPNSQRISISGVQEKYSLLLEKNKLRLLKKGEQGTYILKPIPQFGKKQALIPANEHLTMQIARQVYQIETAENALLFFPDGKPAYLTKRFDINAKGARLAKEDFASLAGRTPQTHGENYKYLGNYLALFNLLEKYVNPHKIEALKLFKILLFNYLFSNGDAHIKNFSVLETTDGDFRLSPAYDMLNTQIHVDDSVFALEEGLLPKSLAKGKVKKQFYTLAEKANLHPQSVKKIFTEVLSNSEKVITLIEASYLDEKTKRQYIQAYQDRYKKLIRE